MGFCFVGFIFLYCRKNSVVYLGSDQAQIDLRGRLVRPPVQVPEFRTNDVTIIVDCGHPPDIAAVGDLIAVSVEAIAGAAVGDCLLRAAQIVPLSL